MIPSSNNPKPPSAPFVPPSATPDPCTTRQQLSVRSAACDPQGLQRIGPSTSAAFWPVHNYRT